MSEERVQDFTQGDWGVEVSYDEKWGDCMQVASVNNESPLTIEADDDPNETVPFTGWRVSLDRAGIDALIEKLQDVRARLASA
jgi:hypothetical protein